MHCRLVLVRYCRGVNTGEPCQSNAREKSPNSAISLHLRAIPSMHSQGNAPMLMKVQIRVLPLAGTTIRWCPLAAKLPPKRVSTSSLCYLLEQGRGRRPIPISAASAVFGLRLMRASLIGRVVGRLIARPSTTFGLMHPSLCHCARPVKHRINEFSLSSRCAIRDTMPPDHRRRLYSSSTPRE